MKRLALVAVGTGYGRLPMTEFARGLREATDSDYPPVETIVVVVPKEDDAATIRDVSR